MSPLPPSLCTGQSSLALLLWILWVTPCISAVLIHWSLSAQLLMGIKLMAGPLWAFWVLGEIYFEGML